MPAIPVLPILLKWLMILKNLPIIIEKAMELVAIIKGLIPTGDGQIKQTMVDYGTMALLQAKACELETCIKKHEPKEVKK